MGGLCKCVCKAELGLHSAANFRGVLIITHEFANLDYTLWQHAHRERGAFASCWRVAHFQKGGPMRRDALSHAHRLATLHF